MLSMAGKTCKGCGGVFMNVQLPGGRPAVLETEYPWVSKSTETVLTFRDCSDITQQQHVAGGLAILSQYHNTHVLAGHLSSGPALLLKPCGTNNSENNNCTTMKIFSSSFCLQMQWKLVSNLNSAPRGPLAGPPQAPHRPPGIISKFTTKIVLQNLYKIIRI